MIESYYYSDWTQLIEDLKKNSKPSKIYRGHSNGYSKTRIKITKESFASGEWKMRLDLIRWKLISSFDRKIEGKYPFIFYLGQQLSTGCFREEYQDYKYPLIKKLSKCGLLERIYFLQHYGVPTCFLDFTKNPLIALYFAITEVKDSILYPLDHIGNIQVYPPEKLYVSIFEFDYKRIAGILKIKSITKDFNIMSYGLFQINGAHIGFDINPFENSDGVVPNENLKRQKGCFVLYELGKKEISLDEFICNELLKKGIKEYGLIREYRLDYNAIFKKRDIETFKTISLFSYLDNKRSTGRHLFNDIQGLRYDLNFFNR
jgi:hypothetical protein